MMDLSMLKCFAVYLRCAAGPTWGKERIRVEVKNVRDDSTAASKAKQLMRKAMPDREGAAWYAERVEALA